jgi:hypothetical protein
MKEINLTQPVMQRVAGYEKRQVSKWQLRFRLELAILGLSLLLLIYLTVRQLMIDHTFDLLTVFTEDREVLSMFWQDTVITFWNELPQLDIIIGLVVLLVIVGLIFITSRMRNINHKKLELLKKYLK